MKKGSGLTGYILKVVLLVIIGTGLTEALASTGRLQPDLIFRLIPPFLFGIFSVVFHKVLLDAIAGRPQRFVSVFMGLTGLKMFVHLLVMLAVAFLYPEIAVHFIALYAVYYLVFTVFEIVSLMPLVRTNSSGPQT